MMRFVFIFIIFSMKVFGQSKGDTDSSYLDNLLYNTCHQYNEKAFVLRFGKHINYNDIIKVFGDVPIDYVRLTEIINGGYHPIVNSSPAIKGMGELILYHSKRSIDKYVAIDNLMSRLSKISYKRDEAKFQTALNSGTFLYNNFVNFDGVKELDKYILKDQETGKFNLSLYTFFRDLATSKPFKAIKDSEITLNLTEAEKGAIRKSIERKVLKGKSREDFAKEFFNDYSEEVYRKTSGGFEVIKGRKAKEIRLKQIDDYIQDKVKQELIKIDGIKVLKKEEYQKAFEDFVQEARSNYLQLRSNEKAPMIDCGNYKLSDKDIRDTLIKKFKPEPEDFNYDLSY